MLGILLIACLIMGPRQRWVKKFLPNTANRVVFTVVIVALIVFSLFQGISVLALGERGLGYYTLAYSVLCIVGLYRFIHVWWIRPPQQNPPSAAVQHLP